VVLAEGLALATPALAVARLRLRKHAGDLFKMIAEPRDDTNPDANRFTIGNRPIRRIVSQPFFGP
jgi:hypothetical protein